MRPRVTGPPLLAALVLAASLGAGCVRNEARGKQQRSDRRASAVLLITGDLRGYLEPCGCTANMRGGLPRAAYQVAAVHQQGAPVLFLDAGNTLFGEGPFTKARIPQEELKARTLAEALRRMGLSLRAPGELDDVRGEAFRRGLGLPELAHGEPRLLEVGGVRLAVVSAHDGEVLAAGARAARAAGAGFVLGLLHQPLERAQHVAAREALGVDVVIAARSEGEFTAEENRHIQGKVPTVQLQSKGRSLLRIDLFAGGEGPFEALRTEADRDRDVALVEERMELLKRQIDTPELDPRARALRQEKLDELVARRAGLATASLEAPADKNGFALRFLPLETSLPEDPAMRGLLAAYDRKVGELNLEWARAHAEDCPPAAEGHAGYVGSATCRECHEEAFGVFEASKHARAYGTLVDLGKQYHLDCVQCHVTGFDSPGGVCRVDRTAARQDVGCESCHGPGSLHAESPSDDNVIGSPGPPQCAGCHNPEHSPHFDFATFVPKTLGPGHGADAD